MNNLDKISLINHANLKYSNKLNNNFNKSKRNRIVHNIHNNNLKYNSTSTSNFKINQLLSILFILFNLICFATCQVRYTSMIFILFH
jgi:hypothetical protein